MNANGNSESQVEVPQKLQPYAEPYPTFIQTPSLPAESPGHQPYNESSNSELHPLTFEPYHSNHYRPRLDHFYQTCLPETGDCCQTWPNVNKQTRDTPYYPNLTCPIQPQCQPHQRQSSELIPERDPHTNSPKGEVERATALQQNVYSTYEEQQSEMADLIRQVALLTEMVKEVRENRANHEEEGSNGEDGVVETTEGRSGVVFQED